MIGWYIAVNSRGWISRKLKKNLKVNKLKLSRTLWCPFREREIEKKSKSYFCCRRRRRRRRRVVATGEIFHVILESLKNTMAQTIWNWIEWMRACMSMDTLWNCWYINPFFFSSSYCMSKWIIIWLQFDSFNSSFLIGANYSHCD